MWVSGRLGIQWVRLEACGLVGDLGYEWVRFCSRHTGQWGTWDTVG